MRPALLLFLAATVSAQLPDPAVPAGLGVNIHFIEPQQRDIEMIAAAGFKFVRMDFGWGHVERQKGQYDFSGYERLVASLAQRGIRALFILDYDNRLYCDNRSVTTDAARQAFARYAAAAAEKFRGRGVIWELWNEPNIEQFWRPKPNVDDYMALAKATLPAIRKADPAATIIAPATSTMDFKFLEECFQRGLLEWVDAVSVHPYRETPPETVGADYDRLRALIARHTKQPRPIISGEWGYSSAGISPEKQGQYIARQFLVNLMHAIPLSIWYDWHDDGRDAGEREHNFGTVTWDYEKKPAYLAAQKLVTQLAGFRYAKRLPLPSDKDYALVFSNGKSEKLAVWTTDTAHKAALNYRNLPEIELTGTPQYLTPSP